MRKIVLIIASTIIGCLGVLAQEPIGGTSVLENNKEVPVQDIVGNELNNSQTQQLTNPATPSYDYVLPNRYDNDFLYQYRDSLHLPPLSFNGHVRPIGMYPLSWGGWYSWDLHKGLNVSVGASVFAQFGKHARHGAGFSQNFSAMYAMPLTDKLSLAIGGYMNNVYWAHDSYRDAGVSAVLGYQFDERWEAYLYAQKSLVDNKKFMPYPLYDMGELRDRIGAAVKYNFSPNFSVQISVERDEYK